MEEISLKFDFHGLEYIVIFPTKKRALKSDFGWRSYAFSSDVTAGPMFGKFPYVYAVGYHQSIPRKFILALRTKEIAISVIFWIPQVPNGDQRAWKIAKTNAITHGRRITHGKD